MEQPTQTNIAVPPKLVAILQVIEQRKRDILQGFMATMPEGNYNLSADCTTLVRTEGNPHA